MHYFAYGSNMSTRRLQQRIVSAQPVAVATLSGHRLAFHKLSKVDQSGKCDIPESGSPDDIIFGVIYDIASKDKPRLDAIEGLGDGYEIKEVTVLGKDNIEYTAFAYYATLIDESLKPYHWYKEHVLRGAKEHQLPADYIDQINRVESVTDPDSVRSKAQLNIYTITS